MFSYRCTCVLDDGVTCRPGIRTGCFRLHIGLRSCWEYTFCTDLCVSSAAFAADCGAISGRRHSCARLTFEAPRGFAEDQDMCSGDDGVSCRRRAGAFPATLAASRLGWWCADTFRADSCVLSYQKRSKVPVLGQRRSRCNVNRYARVDWNTTQSVLHPVQEYTSNDAQCTRPMKQTDRPTVVCRRWVLDDVCESPPAARLGAPLPATVLVIEKPPQAGSPGTAFGIHHSAIRRP